MPKIHHIPTRYMGIYESYVIGFWAVRRKRLTLNQVVRAVKLGAHDGKNENHYHEHKCQIAQATEASKNYGYEQIQCGP